MSRSRRWRVQSASQKGARAVTSASKNTMPDNVNYSAWSHESLIERVTQLEKELKDKTKSVTSVPQKKSWKKPRAEGVFNPSKYSTRLIALKLAYLGKRYNGFEHHSGQVTPLPTIEEELWKALTKARLIFPKDTPNPLPPGECNWEGTEYSKCGRTDKGVSAFGQVIGIRVRSNRPLVVKRNADVEMVDDEGGSNGVEMRQDEMDMEYAKSETGEGFNTAHPQNGTEPAARPLSPSKRKGVEMASENLVLNDFEPGDSLNFDPLVDEIQYPSVLNRLLPPDIRILAWCPSPPLDFSARFSCRERRYRYFFTQPAFSPMPFHLESGTNSKQFGPMKDGWLDIDAMREAAKSFVGVHDFRNFCKVDPGKQITNFQRRIFHADIEEVEHSTSSLAFVNGPHFPPSSQNGDVPAYPRVYTFTLHGSAFLWHQVRHMVAILFLVGQRLENPSIVIELLDVEKNPGRPTYDMATDTPLVLWDCIFPHEDDTERKDAMQWVYVGDGPSNGHAKYGSGGLVEDIWKVWRERKIDQVLASSLLDVVAKQGNAVAELTPGSSKKGSKSQKVFDGGDAPRLQGTYIPVMEKPLMESVDFINDKYAVRKGFESAEDMKTKGFRSRVNDTDVP